MPISQAEANQIATRIDPIFQHVLNEYDLGKYPAENYANFKIIFSNLNPTDIQIREAMIWKWGHWGKSDFPQHHKNLIAEIQSLWLAFSESSCSSTSRQTYEWWREQLNRKTRYITVAYITHLVHHSEPLPIIDQHNFRAMNALIGCLHPSTRPKKKPSNWNDIISLKSFMEKLQAALHNRSFSELDRFLMMYGRNHVAR